MDRRARILIALAAIAAIAAHGPARDELADLLGGRTAGAPVDCIDPVDVQSTRVVAGRAIVYESYGKLFVNRPDGAERLRRDDILFQRIGSAQLCRADPVKLLDPVTRSEHNFVLLGPFTPYTKPR